jgi:hypothetical protein
MIGEKVSDLIKDEQKLHPWHESKFIHA